MKKDTKNKMFYFLIGCIVLSLLIVGSTYAYFSASTKDDKSVQGTTSTVNFGLSVERVTTVDMAYGLVPMKDEQAPNAAIQMCRDNFNNAGCQIYKITLKSDSDKAFFIDGYITTTTQDEEVETRFSRVYPKEVPSGEGNEMVQVFGTQYTKEDFDDEDFYVERYVKNGKRTTSEDTVLNNRDDYSCLFAENEQVGGDSSGVIIFYVMIWVHDNGKAQDFMQGMTKAYSGTVTISTAGGNEIKASFD